MAGAPGHRLGQIIGDMLELSLEPTLKGYAKEYDLYLDKKGPRGTRNGVNVTREDAKGNKHDLDYVMERGGTDTKIGLPVAFIEVAWRRYTKHSKNKAQEIEGATVPLVERYSNVKPFAGVVLAGYFTKTSIEQLKSHNFSVIFIPFTVVVDIFAKYGVDANFGEATTDEYLHEQIDKYDALSEADRLKLAQDFQASEPGQFEQFKKALFRVLGRQIKSIRLFPLYGDPCDFNDMASASSYLDSFEQSSSSSFQRIEVSITYSNDDVITGSFNDPSDAKEYLEINAG